MYCLLINNDFSNYPKIHQFLIFKNKKEGRIEEIYINLIDSDKYQIRYHLLPGMQWMIFLNVLQIQKNQ